MSKKATLFIVVLIVTINAANGVKCRPRRLKNTMSTTDPSTSSK
jgi:hypothetical protein